ARICAWTACRDLRHRSLRRMDRARARAICRQSANPPADALSGNRDSSLEPVKPPLAALEPNETERLLADIYYLNTAELRGFCDAHKIPYTIRIESPDGRFTRSKDADRKGIVIDRVVHFLKTGNVKPATTFRRQVVGGSKELARAPFESDQ